MFLESAVQQLVKVVPLVGDIALVYCGSRWTSISQPVLHNKLLETQQKSAVILKRTTHLHLGHWLFFALNLTSDSAT